MRYDEVAAGAINHALRFTAPTTRRAYIYPARHFASDSTDQSLPPMGLRVRLKASVDIFTLRTPGAGLADRAQAVRHDPGRQRITLVCDRRTVAGWHDDDLHQLQQLHGSDFEVVDTSSLVNGS